MALYAIGDLHLCLGAEKPMDIFGGAWVGYMDKLREGFSQMTPADTTVLLGDLSWALSLDGAKADFAFINDIPGKKVILKGNHDYWWSTAKKFGEFCQANGFSDMQILNNNHFAYENIAICGTRGWFYDDKADKKIIAREVGRLEKSLTEAEKTGMPILCFLHYPPVYNGEVCDEIFAVIKKPKLGIDCPKSCKAKTINMKNSKSFQPSEALAKVDTVS